LAASTVDIGRNSIKEGHVDLEKLGRKLGALHSYEHLEQ